MGGVNLHAVETRVLTHLGRRGEAIDDVLNLAASELARNRGSGKSKRDGAGRHGGVTEVEHAGGWILTVLAVTLAALLAALSVRPATEPRLDVVV